MKLMGFSCSSKSYISRQPLRCKWHLLRNYPGNSSLLWWWKNWTSFWTGKSTTYTGGSKSWYIILQVMFHFCHTQRLYQIYVPFVLFSGPKWHMYVKFVHLKDNYFLSYKSIPWMMTIWRFKPLKSAGMVLIYSSRYSSTAVLRGYAN